MGVAGSGKTTLARALARATGCAFLEGDALHPVANLRKMADGRPLDEADRLPWLDAVAAWLAKRRAAAECAILTCSALKRSHRDRLRRADPDLRLLWPHPDRATLEQRLASRVGHVFPPHLLASQLDAFEPPGADEHAMPVDARLQVDEAVASVRARLGL